MIRTRFSLSPTGSLHIGGFRTALYSYALAKSQNGKFILCIEDTDKKREIPQAVEMIKKDLQIFGLSWDEYYVQSERVASGIYLNAAEKLVAAGHAFYCRCQPKDAKKDGYSKILRDPCRDKNFKSGAIKLKVPDNESVSFIDYVLNKKVGWNTSEVADTTLLKSDGFPTCHLALVVDDAGMAITHVLRGHDWVPSTPIHILIYKYLGFKMPEIGHITDILDPEGKGKMSKRKGSVSIKGFLAEGYLKEALLNFVMLLGWAPKDNTEIFSLNEFVTHFGPEGLQKSNPIFNREKLLWLNSHYMQSLPTGELAKRVYQFYGHKYELSLIKQIVPLLNRHVKLLSEFEDMTKFFFEEPQAIDPDFKSSDFKKHLSSVHQTLKSLKNWDLETINGRIMAMIEKEGFKVGKFFIDLRLAITGAKIIPPINESLVILGKTETLNSIHKHIN